MEYVLTISSYPIKGIGYCDITIDGEGKSIEDLSNEEYHNVIKALKRLTSHIEREGRDKQLIQINS